MFNLGRENTGLLAKWWRNVDKQILFLFIFLVFLGLFFSFSSTTSIMSDKMNKQMYFFFIKHLIFASIAIFLFFTISMPDKDKLIKILSYLFFISIFLLVLTIFFGVEIKGSKRWLTIEPFPRFQPVELVKPLFVVFIAKIIVMNNNISLYKRYLFSFLILLLIVLILINQPDLGQTFLLTLTWITMIFVSGFNMILLFILALIFIATIFFLIYLMPEKFGYILFRIKTFLNPNAGDNFQSEKALEAIKQGVLQDKGWVKEF